MKRAVSISLGSAQRDKKAIIQLNDQRVQVERIGTDGDVTRAQRLFREFDGRVDALGVGGVDLYLRLGAREYPLHAALRLVQDVRHTPVVDGRGLKHTLERRVFELAASQFEQPPHFRRAFIPMAVDRIGLAEAVAEVADQVAMGDFLTGLGLPIVIRSLDTYRRLAPLFFPILGRLPMRLIFYGGQAATPRYRREWSQFSLLAGDFLFMQRYLPYDLRGKTILTNTTTEEDVALLGSRGVRQVITTTPLCDGRSFGTNLLEAALTACAGLGRPLTDGELNQLIDELDLRPSVRTLNGLAPPESLSRGESEQTRRPGGFEQESGG